MAMSKKMKRTGAALLAVILAAAVFSFLPVPESYASSEVYDGSVSVESQGETTDTGDVVLPEIAIQNNAIGDITGDNKIDAADITALAKHVAGIKTIKATAAKKAADVNRDGTVDASDITHLAKYVAHIITSL